MNLREERIEELTHLIAARIPPRKIELAAPTAGVETPLPAIEQSPRAKAIRRISEIVSMRGWLIAVTRELDANNASHISDLSDAAVFKLRDRMEYFEDCAQTCSDPEDALPAR